MKSFAAAAASGRPKTGAATKRWPASTCTAASLSDNATLIVLHGDVDRTLAQAADHALVAEHDALERGIVRHHRQHGVAAAGVRHVGGGVRA